MSGGSAAGAPGKRSSTKASRVASGFGSSRHLNAAPGPVKQCLLDAGAWYKHFSQETIFGEALTSEFGALFNFLVSHIVFWSVGFPLAVDHGYDADRDGEYGEQQVGRGGPVGSGMSRASPLTIPPRWHSVRK
jgi:hypothetical protein